MIAPAVANEFAKMRRLRTVPVLAVMVIGVVALSSYAFTAPGFMDSLDDPAGHPWRWLLAGLAFAVPLVSPLLLPVAALQSGLSMLMRSFAAPVAVALLGAVTGAFLLVVRLDALSMILPYGLIGRATQLGTGTFADSGTVPPATVALLIAVALGATAVVVAVFSALLDRRDIG